MISPIRLLTDAPHQGAWNMAVDEALMESARQGLVTVRFYAWEPACLSFGRNQTAAGRYDGAEAAVRGIDVVRRPTGGRAVYHHRELTYSVVAPTAAWGSLRDAYCRINRALAAGLSGLGAPVACAGALEASVAGSVAQLPRPTARACFRDPLPGEVTARGRKLVGSAQWRDGGALLQHGSILLENEQRVAEELRTGARTEGPSDDVGAIALGDLLSNLPTSDDLVQSLAAGFEEEFARPITPGALTDREAALSTELVPRYRDPEWTWRR